MSVRFDASGDYLRRTANLPSNTAYTICGWARLVTDTNTYSTIASIESATTSAGAYALLSTDVDGVSLKHWGSGGTSGTLATLTVGTDFFWAITCGATGANGATAYYRAKGSTALSSVLGYGDAFTPAVIYLANDSYTEPFNGRIWNVKVWNRVLTAAELLAESYYRKVKFPTSRNAHWEMRSSSDTVDRSGLGYSLTVGGTLATETEGVNLWVPKSSVGRFVAAGGSSSYTFTPSGSITFSGGTVLVRGKVLQPGGTLALSGSASLIRGRVFLPSGGIVFSGAPTIAHGKVFQPSGQITFSGTAPFSTLNQYTFVPSGSVVFSGTNLFVRGKAFAPGGSIAFQGTNTFVRGKVLQTSGQITFSGGVTNLTRGKVWEPSGSIQFGGTASLIFTPAGGSPVSALNKISMYVSRTMRLS